MSYRADVGLSASTRRGTAQKHCSAATALADTLSSTMGINEIVKQLDEGIRQLQEARGVLTGMVNSSGQSSGGRGRRGRTSMSQAARDRIAAAQRARWARQKGQNTASAPTSVSASSAAAPKKSRRRLSRAARASIAAAQKARWARVRAQKKK